MQHRCVEYSVERVYPLTTLTLLTIGLAVYLYSLRCFDAPVPAGIRFFLALLRIFFLAGLLWLITGPQLMETMQITQLPSLFAVLDDTGSMGYPIEPQPGNQSPSRFQAVMQKIQTDYIPYWKKRGYDTRFALLSSLSAPDQDANPWLVQSPGSTSAGFSYTDIGKAVHSFAASKTTGAVPICCFFPMGNGITAMILYRMLPLSYPAAPGIPRRYPKFFRLASAPSGTSSTWWWIKSGSRQCPGGRTAESDRACDRSRVASG